MQYRFSEIRRLAWLTLVSDILRVFTKEYITQFQVCIPFAFFICSFYKMLLTLNENSNSTVGMYDKYPWSERGKGFYFQYCYSWRRWLETCLLSLCSLNTLRPLFQVLCSFLAFSTSWEDYILWFWSLRSEPNLSVHLAHRKCLKFLPRPMRVFL